MTYQTDSMVLDTVREVYSGPVNSVVICQDLASPHPMYYTLLVIRDRACAKTMLKVLQDSDRPSPEDAGLAMRCFSQNEELVYLFPYRKERPFTAFAQGQMSSLQEREATCVNLVMECLYTSLPFPLLYLVLDQGNLHIEQDNNVFFTYYLNLEELDPEMGEADCARLCAHYILSLLTPPQGKGRLQSLELIRRKLDKNAYRGLPELYRDIKVTSLPQHKRSLKARLKHFWRENKDRLFRLLLVLCVAAGAIALVALLSQLIFGDFPLARLFERRFEMIGTESLTGK